MQLTPTERAFLDQFLESGKRGGRVGAHVGDLDYLLDRWERFVGRVETGFDYVIEEYWAETTIRDILQELSERAPESLRSKIDDWAGPLDARYIASTDEDPHGRFPWYR